MGTSNYKLLSTNYEYSEKDDDRSPPPSTFDLRRINQGRASRVESSACHMRDVDCGPVWYVWYVVAQLCRVCVKKTKKERKSEARGKRRTTNRSRVEKRRSENVMIHDEIMRTLSTVKGTLKNLVERFETRESRGQKHAARQVHDCSVVFETVLPHSTDSNPSSFVKVRFIMKVLSTLSMSNASTRPWGRGADRSDTELIIFGSKRGVISLFL